MGATMGVGRALDWQPDPPDQAIRDDEVWPLLEDLLARDPAMAERPHKAQRAALAALIEAAFGR